MALERYVTGTRTYLEPRVLLLGLTVLAAVLALYRLGHESIWLDEGSSISFVKLSWGDMWEVIADRQGNQSAYYVILNFWSRLGDSEFFLRGLSATFAIASVPALYLLASRLFDRKVALIACLLMSTNEFWLEYAQELRAYSLVLLVSIVSTYVFVLAVEKPSPSRWFAYSLLAVLLLYSHLFGILLVAAHFASLLVLPRKEVPWENAIISGLTFGLLAIPMAVFVLSTGGQIDWVRDITVSRAVGFFRDLAGGSSWVLFVYLVAAATASLLALRSWQGNGQSLETWRWALVLFAVVLPLGIGIGYSLHKSVLVPRFFMISFAPLVLLVSLGLSQLTRPLLLGAVLLTIVALSVSGISSYYSYEKENWRDAAALLLTEARKGDAITFYLSTGRNSYYYYADRAKAGPRPELYLQSTKRDTGATLAEEYERVWLVLTHNTRTEGSEKTKEVMDSLSKEYTATLDQQFDGVRVVLYARSDASVHDFR